MADTNDLARAREALTAPAGTLDAAVLDAVHDGLLSVPADRFVTGRSTEDAPGLAVRRRPSH
jgi:hypothetical protein